MFNATPIRLVRMGGYARLAQRIVPSAVLAFLLGERIPAIPLIAPLIGQLLFWPGQRSITWVGHLPVDAHTQWLSRAAATITSAGIITLAAIAGTNNSAYASGILASVGLAAVALQLLISRFIESPAGETRIGLLLAFVFAIEGVALGFVDTGAVVAGCEVALPVLLAAVVALDLHIDSAWPRAFLGGEEKPKTVTRANPTALLSSFLFGVCATVIGGGPILVVSSIFNGAEFVIASHWALHLPGSLRGLFARRALPLLAAMALASSTALATGSLRHMDLGQYRAAQLFERVWISSDGAEKEQLRPLPLFLKRGDVWPWNERIPWNKEVFWTRLDEHPEVWLTTKGKVALGAFLVFVFMWSFFVIFRHWFMLMWAGCLAAATYLNGPWVRLPRLLSPENVLPDGWSLGSSSAITFALVTIAYLAAQEAFVRRRGRQP